MSKKELIKLLEELIGSLTPLMLRQIDKFVKSGLTHKDIARAVYYIYEVQSREQSKLPTYGLGLVPFYKDEANKYYDNIVRQKEQQARQVKEGVKIGSREVRPQGRRKKRRDIDISEL